MFRKHASLLIDDYRQSWLRRILHVSGDTESVLDFDARPVGIGGADYVEVRVDGSALGKWKFMPPYKRQEVVVQVPGWKSRFDFEVQLSNFGVYQIRYFKLAVRGEVLYEESMGKVIRARGLRDLPLPSAATAPEPDELPIPAYPEPHR